MGTENPIEDIVRITVRGIPLSVDDTCIKDMLEKLSTILTSDINKEKIRNPNTFKMINIELKSYIYIYMGPMENGEYPPKSSECSKVLKLFHIWIFKWKWTLMVTIQQNFMISVITSNFL